MPEGDISTSAGPLKLLRISAYAGIITCVYQVADRFADKKVCICFDTEVNTEEVLRFSSDWFLLDKCQLLTLKVLDKMLVLILLQLSCSLPQERRRGGM